MERINAGFGYGEDGKVAAASQRAALESASSPLDNITERISRVARNIQEIGIRLNGHADAVHGHTVAVHSPSPEAGRAGSDPTVQNQKSGALPRIYDALDELDAALHYVAEAAGRNWPLA